MDNEKGEFEVLTFIWCSLGRNYIIFMMKTRGVREKRGSRRDKY